MSIWKQAEVVEKLRELDYLVEVGEYPGGDWDLIPLFVSISDEEGADKIRIVPFTDPQGNSVADPKADQPIVAVEVLNLAGDSSGGCETDDEQIHDLYNTVLKVLRGLKHRTIRHYDEIF